MCIHYFSYGAGDVIISFSDSLAHRVSSWRDSGKMSPQKHLTPGRIATVFFFPKVSLKLLQGKEEGWGLKTNFGKSPDHAHQGCKVVKRRKIVKDAK